MFSCGIQAIGDAPDEVEVELVELVEGRSLVRILVEMCSSSLS